jgi:hypothetical protein
VTRFTGPQPAGEDTVSIAILLAALPVMTLLLIGAARLEVTLERTPEAPAVPDR